MGGRLTRARSGQPPIIDRSALLASRQLLDFDALRTELKLPGAFPADVVAEAAESAARPRTDLTRWPDRTDLELITVDPTGSRDLDQALHIERLPTAKPAGHNAAGHNAAGYLVSYAIADVASFVRPGGALDGVTRERGQTLYFPDTRIPLHPPLLSEGAASLLPGELRPAVLWQIVLDGQGVMTSAFVGRALVRSREQWDYDQLQAACEQGAPPAAAQWLLTVGSLRARLARARGAITLNSPEQEVVRAGPGSAARWELEFRASLPVESANAEISLLTGMAAAELMLGAGIGILRTLPTPDAGTVEALRRTALALGVAWAAGEEPGAVLARVDPSEPRSAAFIEQSASLLRGASYLAFDGQPPAAAAAAHAGIGAPYAHVTAPLRRLVDRFGSELCLAISADAAPPEWVRVALPTLAANMAASDRLAHEVDRAVIDATEVFLLAERVGEEFDAVVLSAGKTSATIALDSPAVRAKCDLAPGSELPVGQRVRVVLIFVDPATREARFALAGLASSPSRVTSLPSANGKGGDTIRSGEASQPR